MRFPDGLNLLTNTRARSLGRSSETISLACVLQTAKNIIDVITFIMPAFSLKNCFLRIALFARAETRQESL